MKEFFQSILDSYRDRIKSPLIGSFVLTFLIANWKSIAILFFSDWPIHCRIEWAEEHFNNIDHFWIPLLIAFGYVLILPYINIGFEKLLKNHSEYRTDKRNKARENELIQKKTEAGLLREIADAQAGTSEITRLTNKITDLNTEITSQAEFNKLEIERYKEKEKRNSDIITDFSLEIEKLDKQNKALNELLKNNLNESENNLLPVFIKKIIGLLSDKEKLFFVDFCDFRIYKTANQLSDDESTVKKFIEMGLITGDPSGTRFEITDRGEFIYQICKNHLLL